MSGIIEGLKPKAKKRKQESQESKKFKVYINKGEMERILEWVKLKPDIETGGDLFGLWLDDHTAVVQFVLGPGKGCHRTTTSFFQDISYLGDAGSFLTEKHGLCNIGQWHSHHKIPLFEPSVGDCNTVWSNMPKLGMERYIVFIANITHSDVTVNCFLFEMKDGQQRPVVKGCFYELQGESPLRLNKAVMEIVSNGAEILSKKDQMSDLPDEHSEQNETKTALIIKGDNGTPGEKEMRNTQSVCVKDSTVPASENATESKEIVNSERRENNNNKETSDNISSQSNNNNSGSNNIKNGNSNKENISNKNTISENIRISRKNFNGDNSNTDNKKHNVNTTPTTIATTTTNKDESPRGKERVKLEGNQCADGTFCFQTTSSQQNDSKDNLSNKLETMPTPSNEKQENGPIPQDTTEKKPRCPNQYDNIKVFSAETTESEQERVIQERPKSQNEEPVNASSVWGRFWRHLPCVSWHP